MNKESNNRDMTASGGMDRRIIQIEVPPSHAGIMIALRRAFEEAATEPCDRDFAELLRQLN